MNDLTRNDFQRLEDIVTKHVRNLEDCYSLMVFEITELWDLCDKDSNDPLVPAYYTKMNLLKKLRKQNRQALKGASETQRKLKMLLGKSQNE